MNRSAIGLCVYLAAAVTACGPDGASPSDEASTDAIATCPAPLASVPAVEPGAWTWQFFKYAGDLWLQSSKNGHPRFQYRLGAGGSIAQVRDAEQYRDLLMPPTTAGPDSDRVIQGVLWATNVCPRGVDCSVNFDARYNLNHAGGNSDPANPSLNRLAAVYAVEVDSASQRVDVWAKTKYQFLPQYQSAFAGTDPVPYLARYEWLPDGVLKIRRVQRLPEIVVNGQVQTGVKHYADEWIPLKRDPAVFTDLATSLGSGGAPAYYWRSGYNLPAGPRSVTSTELGACDGYLMAFRQGAWNTSPVFGVMYRPEAMEVYGAELDQLAHTQIELHDYSSLGGIGITPVWRFQGASKKSLAGGILDYEVLVHPRGQSNATVQQVLRTYPWAASRARVYGPSAPLPPDLADIKTRLEGYLNAPYAAWQQTAHLGPFRP